MQTSDRLIDVPLQREEHSKLIAQKLQLWSGQTDCRGGCRLTLEIAIKAREAHSRSKKKKGLEKVKGIPLPRI